MNKYYKGAVILWIILSVISYALFAFIALDLKASEWTSAGRAAFAFWIVLLCIGCFSVAISKIQEKERETKLGEAPDEDD